MSYNGKNTRIRHYLNNNQVDDPLDEIEVEAHFGTNVQALVALSRFVFTNEEAQTIKSWFDAGNAFKGLPYKIETYNDTNNLVALNGYLNPATIEDSIDFNNRLSISLVKDDGLEKLETQLSALTFTLLEDKNIFTSSDYEDLNYIVEKKINFFEMLVSSVILYLMIKELAETIKAIASDISDIVGLATGGGMGFGLIASIILAVIKLLVTTVYALTMVAAIINLGKQMLDTLLPPVRTHKVLKLKTAMTKICGFLGYTFDTDLTDLDDIKYLPSNPQLNDEKLSKWIQFSKGTPTGLPNASDYGYQCSQFFEMVRTLTNGQFALKNNVVYLRNKHSNFWVKQSTWTKPEPLDTVKSNNAGEIKGTRVFAFRTDQSDTWTVENTTGFYYQVNVDSPSIPTPQKQISGYEEINFNVSLGTRRDDLNELEEFLKNVAKKIDKVVNKLGGNSNLESKITNKRTGGLRQSQNWHALPKLVTVQSKKLPTNYRDILSAKAIYNKHYALDSFATGKGQKLIFKNEEIPFGLNDAVLLIDNSYFYKSNAKCKILSLSWGAKKDTAVISYEQEHKYDNSLTEITLEE